MPYPQLIENLILELSKLPGIGRRSAERIVFWILNQQPGDVQKLSEGILSLKTGLMFCRICNNLSQTEICPICSDTRRDQSIICVVEDPKDLLAIDRTGTFRGQYHVLLGSISPSEGRGPETLRIAQLIKRVAGGDVKEVVLATDADTDGEMTALYLIKELRPTGVKVSRIGLGLPVGSAVEFVDMSTLSMSLASRREILD
jgi:recombination protein RecR